MTEHPGGVLLTVPQVAEALAIHRATVYDLMNRGELESVKLGSARRVPRDALEDFVRRLREEAAS